MRLIELFTLQEQSKYGLKNFVKRDAILKDPEKAAVGIVKELQKVSADWLNQTKNGSHTVYRGDAGSEAIVVKKLIRTNRRPMDTSIEHHKLANEIFKDMGFTANRSNSMFVAGDSQAAAHYGEQVWAVIPIGKFSYTWSPEVEDLTEDVFSEVGAKFGNVLHELYKAVNNKVRDHYGNKMHDVKHKIQELKAKIKKANKQTSLTTLQKEKKDLQKLETILKKLTKDFHKERDRIFDNYKTKIVLPAKWLSSDEIKKIRMDSKPDKEDVRKEYFSKYQGDNGSLIKAIKSNNEIMISSADGGPLTALLIHDGIWEKFVRPILRGGKPLKKNIARIEDILDGYY